MLLCAIKQPVLISLVSNSILICNQLFYYYDFLTCLGTLTAPENFTALSTNSREIQFSWTLPSHVGADPTRININYNLTCRPNTFGVTSVAMTYSEAGSHTLGGFRPATEYNCSVFAFTGTRSGPFTSVNVTTVNDCKSEH